jgi:hypothetical protein
MNALVPLLDLCPHKEFSSLGSGILLRPDESIPGLVGQRIPCANKSLRNHHGDS